MDEMIFSAVSGYYDTLCKLGYYPYKDVYRLLLLSFYRDFVFNDYRGILNRKDYHEIEKALNCLFGSNCLIPYPDYLKMGKLHIGEITEMAHRVTAIEDTPVLKLIHEEGVPGPESDIMLVQTEED